MFQDDPATAVELVTEYVHDGDDRVREVHSPRGGVTKLDVDGLNRPVRAEDPLGNVERVFYDIASRTTELRREDVEPATIRVRSWTYIHDARGRLRSITDPSGATTELDYDDRNLVTERRGPLSTTAQWHYGLLGEVVKEIVDPAGMAITSHHEHDLSGRPLRFVDPTGEETTWTRDLLGRATAVRIADATVWTREHGEVGIVKQTTPGGSQVIFDYEPGTGRLRKMRCIAGAGAEAVPAHAFVLDGLDRVVRAEAGGHAVVRRFDSLNRLVKETYAGRTFAQAFDDAAGSFRLRFPDGREEDHFADLLGRVHRVTLVTPGSSSLGAVSGLPGSVLLDVTYAGVERIAEQRFAGGAAAEWTDDEAGRPVRIEHTGPDAMPLESARLRYDAASRMRVVQLAAAPAENHMLDFDMPGRLVQWRTSFALVSLQDVETAAEQQADIDAAQAAAVQATHTEQYTIDASDTRIAVATIEAGLSTVISYASALGHKVTHVGPDVIAYNTDGMRTAGITRVISYDGLGRATRIDMPGGGETLLRLEYDPLGRWSGGEFAGAPMRRVHFGRLCLQEEGAGDQVLCQRICHPTTSFPAIETRAQGVLALHFDAHHNLLLLTGPSGKPAERYRYSVFGTPRIFDGTGAVERSKSAFGIPPRFGGMPHLGEAEVYWTPYRLYDPATGLFLSRDPLLHAVSFSPYVFARHDPVNLIDPAGDIAWVAVGVFAAVGAVIGAASVMTSGEDYDAADVLAAAAIGAGAGAISALTFGWLSSVLGGAALTSAAGAGTAATNLGVSIGSGALAGAGSGLASGLFSGAAGGAYAGIRSGGDVGSMALHGALQEGAAGMVGGAIGGGLFAGALRAGVIPQGMWASVQGRGQYTPSAVRPEVIGRGILSPYGLGAVGIGFASAYSGGVVRRSIQGASLGQAAAGAVDEGITGAIAGGLTAAIHPTTWQYWRIRTSSTAAEHIEMTRAGGAHHQRNVAQYPELATLRNSRSHTIWEKLNRPFIEDNIRGPFSEYNDPDAIRTHAGMHEIWRFGQQKGGYSDVPTHGPWTPERNVTGLPSFAHLNQQAGGKK